MRKISKIAAAAATAALMTVGAVLVATPASAGDGACSLGYACAWKDSNYNGARVTFQYRIPNMSDYGFNNVASSLANNGRTSNVMWYTGTNYDGSGWLLQRGYWSANLAGTWLQDAISSAKFV
ncbi:peptidase inhibitor family I36 protein [Cellulomonas sp. URHB0016]